MQNWESFKGRLSQCIAKAGSQANLARLSDVHRNTLTNIMKSEKPVEVTDAVLNKLASAVGFNFIWLKTGQGNQEGGKVEGLYSEAEIEHAVKEIAKLEKELGLTISRKNLALTITAALGIFRESEQQGIEPNTHMLRNVIKLAA